jgi:hypothetical protein
MLCCDAERKPNATVVEGGSGRHPTQSRTDAGSADVSGEGSFFFVDVYNNTNGTDNESDVLNVEGLPDSWSLLGA